MKKVKGRVKLNHCLKNSFSISFIDFSNLSTIN